LIEAVPLGMMTTNEVDAGSVVLSVLSSLNSAQLKGMLHVRVFGFRYFDPVPAVQHSPSIPLQILAGPGSGKTKVFIWLKACNTLLICFA
jgi:DNA helicase-2/ATP-dependent DNA helicase PcrA